MRVCVVVSVLWLWLCLSVPAALLSDLSLSADECEEQRGVCVDQHECSAASQSPNLLHIPCEGSKMCCWRNDGLEPRNTLRETPLTQHAKHYDKRKNLVTKSLYLTPEKDSSSSYIFPENTAYAVGQKENDDDPKITDVENSLDSILPNRKSTSSTEEDDVIVFPDTSEETDNDYVGYIKKLYQKYTLDFNKKYNTKQNTENLSKRKLKYAVGHKSAKYCKLYEKFLVDDLFAIPLLPFLFPIPMQNNHCSKPLPLIVGGINASRGEFPHMAGLGYDRGEWIDFLCGGSLISERYVLTAAHCALTKWGPPIMVRLGTSNLITDVGQNVDVENVIVHPAYHEPSSYNDIALVKMVEGLQLSSTLRPACLPSHSSIAGHPGSYLIATGWGKTGYGLFSSPNLQKVSLKVMDNRTCDRMFLGGRRSERLPFGIQNSMLCAAGYLDSSHDTCQGDSGGPLQTLSRHSKCIYEVIGITSFGKLCGTGLPAIYTRVSAYIPWIEDIVWPV